MDRFWNLAAPAALRRENTGLQRQVKPPIRRRRAGPAHHSSRSRIKGQNLSNCQRQQIKGVCSGFVTLAGGALSSLHKHQRSTNSLPARLFKNELFRTSPLTVAKQQHRKTFHSGDALKLQLLLHEMTLNFLRSNPRTCPQEVRWN